MLLRTLRRLPDAGRTAAIRRFAVRTVSGAFAVAAAASAANSQYYGGYDPCCPAQPVCPTVCQPVCQQMAMVVQPCYQQVPVTEYHEEKQTVMRPVTEVEYVDQQVTEYRPITETRTAEQPVVTYQPVTEMQTVCQDRSYWQTYRTPNCRLSPCQYDNRPGLVGWMNRTGYEMRSTFTPRYTTHRQYVPNQVAMQVPTTRMVAQHGTRQVTYNVTKMEPYTTTRQVAVNRVKMVAQEITVSKPVTTFRTVPVGTTVAYAPVGAAGGAVALGSGTITNMAYGPINYGSGGTATAFGPTPDPVSARGSTKVLSRTASGNKDAGKAPAGDAFQRKDPKPAAPADEFGDIPPGASAPRVPRFKRYTAAEREALLNTRRLAKTEPTPAGVAVTHETFKPAVDDSATGPALAAAFKRQETKSPINVRFVSWRPAKPTGPELIAPTLASAE